MFTRIMFLILTLTTALAGLFTVASLADPAGAPSQRAEATATGNLAWYPTATDEAEGQPTQVVLASPTAVIQIFASPEPTNTPEPTRVVSQEPTSAPAVEPTSTPTELPFTRPVGELSPGRAEGWAVLPMDEMYHSQLTETDLPNACGPTALLMVLDYCELEHSLDAVIAHHQSIPPSEGGYDPSCTLNGVCTSPGALVKVAEIYYGVSVEARQGWTFEEVRSAIEGGHPVIADINWRLVPGNFGHFVVIYGVNLDTDTIYYHDPYDGSHRSATWEEFLSAWDGPIDVGDPLQPEGHRRWGMVMME